MAIGDAISWARRSGLLRRFPMAAQRAVRKLLLAVVALYLLFLISVWHVVNRSSARSIAYGVAAWFVSAPQPAARRLEATSPLRAAQPVHIRA